MPAHNFLLFSMQTIIAKRMLYGNALLHSEHVSMTCVHFTDPGLLRKSSSIGRPMGTGRNSAKIRLPCRNARRGNAKPSAPLTRWLSAGRKSQRVRSADLPPALCGRPMRNSGRHGTHFSLVYVHNFILCGKVLTNTRPGTDMASCTCWQSCCPPVQSHIDCCIFPVYSGNLVSCEIGCMQRITIQLILIYLTNRCECTAPMRSCSAYRLGPQKNNKLCGRPPQYAPSPATEAHSGSLEPGLPSRVRWTNYAPSPPAAGRTYAISWSGTQHPLMEELRLHTTSTASEGTVRRFQAERMPSCWHNFAPVTATYYRHTDTSSTLHLIRHAWSVVKASRP